MIKCHSKIFSSFGLASMNGGGFAWMVLYSLLSLFCAWLETIRKRLLKSGVGNSDLGLGVTCRS